MVQLKKNIYEILFCYILCMQNIGMEMVFSSMYTKMHGLNRFHSKIRTPTSGSVG